MKRIILLAALAIAGCGPAQEDSTQQRTAPAQKAINADSLSDGMHRYQDAEGHKVMDGEIQGGQRQGIWTSYHKNGKVQSRSEYVRGLLQGPTVVFRENGVLLYDGQYRNGKEVGAWRFYGENGALDRTVVYDTAGTVISTR